MNRLQVITPTTNPSGLPFQSAANSILNSCYPSDSPMRSKFLPSYYPFRPDKKVMESVNRRLEKLINLCRDPRVMLRNSPPYLLDILPDIADKLKRIMYAYQGCLDELFKSLYFQVFLYNLNEKCELTSKLFKEAKDKMYDDHSEPRRRLTKYSLVLSHILKDLEALFPNNKYAPEAFRITKREAADWWRENFGDSSIVSWEVFRTRLFATFGVLERSEARELQNTIDLTCNYYVSVFEFDVFVRLFQPWTNVLETWRALTIMHAGYMAFMTYDEVKAVLKKFRGHPGPGSYVYRLSCTKLGQWAIGYITENLRILQTIIQNKSLAQALLDGERDGFYLYPNGTPSQSSILTPLLRNITHTRIQVSEEQHQLYSRIGSTFEVCKICTENNKNIRLEPCGHLLCKVCLLNCQNATSGQTCPFCRLEVKSTEEIILDPFIPSNDDDVIGRHAPEVTAEVEEEEEEEKEEEDEEEEVVAEIGREVSESDSNFQDKEIDAVLAALPSASTSTDVMLCSSSIENTSDGEENAVNSPRRKRDSSSCSLRVNEPEVRIPNGPSYLTEAVEAISFDTTAFMRRSDVAGVVLEGPPLTVEVARQLLEICEGNADIAARVWRNFVPRS
ncbi:unnamed protein product [Hydatigera taeniaeformis]|uniref:E3 ubiquitin-protein ligase CBL n=1 Tax=Hydatigena taeniaeformis TaxID=6205 RepID=A0A0R3X4C7_HYDTA|nr:unnamed protein product [Hydatigera taeniaeformis]